MIYTEGQIIHAANAARDLGALVLRYIELFREHANGYNDVRIPDGALFIGFRAQKKEGFLCVVVHKKSEVTNSHEERYEPSGYGVTSDSTDDMGYATRTVYSTHNVYQSKGIDIPMAALLQVDLDAWFKALAKKIAAAKAEADRQGEVDRLEKRLRELRHAAALHGDGKP